VVRSDDPQPQLASTIDDPAGGFSTRVDMTERVVRVVAWGFWSVEVASAFGPTLHEVCRKNPQIKHVSMDMGELKPMREQGQLGFGEFLGALGTLGVERVTVHTTSHLTKLQLLRIARGRASGSSVEFV
jgi:hypothetical protein